MGRQAVVVSGIWKADHLKAEWGTRVLRSGKEKALAETSELMGSCRAAASKHNRQAWLGWSLASTLPFEVQGETEPRPWLHIPKAQIPTRSGGQGPQDPGKLPASSSYLLYYKISALFTHTFNFPYSFLSHIHVPVFPLAIEQMELSIAQWKGWRPWSQTDLASDPSSATAQL